MYDFPKTRLIDGPLQIEARIDQNAQLSGQLTLWNQQGSHVRRGSLIVIPIGRALLYAEPIYLQADRSPMPELRLVVLACRIASLYGPTFESAMAALFGTAASTLSTQSRTAPLRGTAGERGHHGSCHCGRGGSGGPRRPDRRGGSGLLRLPAADRCRQARRGGQKLEELKRTLETLQARRH